MWLVPRTTGYAWSGVRGNPLALKIVAPTIVELFGGEIVPFLAQGEVVFGGVRELLDEQFDRLSEFEQSMFYWLAILREPVSQEELLAVLSTPKAPMLVLEAVDGPRGRSLIELAGRRKLHAAVGGTGVCDCPAHRGGEP